MQARPSGMRRLFLLHPLLFALFPALSLTAHNASEVELDNIWRACVLSLLGTLLLWCVLRLLLGDWQKSALMASFGTLLFFSFGHLHGWLNQFAKVRSRLLLVAIALVFLAAGWGVRRLRRNLAGLTMTVTWIALLLVATPAARIVAYRLRSRDAASAVGVRSGQSGANRPQAAAALPDIYYVILDAYASTETLRSIFGYDNGPFLAYLKAKGFYVAEQSQANYSMTGLSLASSTNMEYLKKPWAEAKRQNIMDWRPFHRLIKNNKVMRALKDRGYKFVNFQSGWAVTAKNENADWDVNCGGLREFERVLAQTTLLRSFGLLKRIDEERRDRILCQFATLAEVQHRIDPPRFVFAHIVSPHPPFVFGRNGERVEGEQEFGEGGQLRNLGEKPWRQKSRYVDQLVFCNQKVRQTLDRILAEARTPPIIVLQADHGSASGRYDQMSDALLRERMGILNAYHLPRGPGVLYPSISPVNTFRVVLNEYFGEHYPLLEDRSFFSQYLPPFAVMDVTAKVAPGTPPRGNP